MAEPCPLDPDAGPCRCGPGSIRCRPERTRLMWNPDCDENPCMCPGEERATPLPPGHTRPIDRQSEKMKEALSATPDQQAALGALARSLAGAWAWGYAAAQRDMLDKPIMGGPGASEWKPTPNPYAAPHNCEDPQIVQHRDRKRPWCNNCGRAADGEMIGRPRAFGPRRG